MGAHVLCCRLLRFAPMMLKMGALESWRWVDEVLKKSHRKIFFRRGEKIFWNYFSKFFFSTFFGFCFQIFFKKIWKQNPKKDGKKTSKKYFQSKFSPRRKNIFRWDFFKPHLRIFSFPTRRSQHLTLPNKKVTAVTVLKGLWQSSCSLWYD